jgi:hypothetical protein
MKTKTTYTPKHASALAAVIATLALALAGTPELPAQTQIPESTIINNGQQNFRWIGDANGGDWAVNTNWSHQPAGNDAQIGDSIEYYPGQTGLQGAYGVYLENVTTDRIITINNTAVTGAFRHLWFDDNATHLNQLSLYRTGLLTYNSILLRNDTTGTNKLFISNYGLGGEGDTQQIQFTVGETANARVLRVKEGGVLQLGGKTEKNGNNLTSIRYAGVLIDGGTFNLENAIKATADASASALYNLGSGGDLTLNTGSIRFTNTSSHADAGYGLVSDIRLNVGGNFTMTGGSIENIGNASRTILLGGAENNITGGTLATNVNYTIIKGNESSFRSAVSLNTVGLRVSGSATATLGITSENHGFTGLTFQQDNAGASGLNLTLKLASDLTQTTGNLPVAYGTVNAGGTTYGIDTNAHTLDITSNYAATAGTWTPTRPGAGDGTATWALNDTSGENTGKIIANGFNFNSANVTVSIGDGITLVAKGDNHPNHLGAGPATISPTSTFLYDGGDGKTSTLASSRALGKLHIRSGTLTAATALTTAGNLHVEAGATFAANANTITANDGVTLDIASATTWGRITGATTLTTTNTLALEFNLLAPDVMTDGNTWTLLDGGLSTQTQPTTVTITGTCALSLVRDATGIWTALADDGALRISFVETTGILSINSAAAVPEPGHAVILFGGIACMLFLCMTVIRRRLRA